MWLGEGEIEEKAWPAELNVFASRQGRENGTRGKRNWMGTKRREETWVGRWEGGRGLRPLKFLAGPLLAVFFVLW